MAAYYDSRQMNRMRQEAIRRSQEMHRRSMINSSHYSQGSRQNADIPPKPEKEEAKSEQQPSAVQNINKPAQKPKNQLTELFSKFTEGKIDNDKLIIIALIIILLKEGADKKLILALGYVLL